MMEVIFDGVARLGDRRSINPEVVGSIPVASTQPGSSRRITTVFQMELAE